MNIKMYSKPTCSYCRMAKEFLIKHQIEFQDLNVAEQKVYWDELQQLTGQSGVPVIDINGQLVIGFNKAKLITLLNIKE